MPDDEGYLRLLKKYLGPIPLAPTLTTKDLVNQLRGAAPADLEGMVSTAKRMAMNRMKESDQSLPPLIWEDFDQAVKRNHISPYSDGQQGSLRIRQV
jgi:SpoVK/Ycf46/Vps4 family AAA+-type ATPase